MNMSSMSGRNASGSEQTPEFDERERPVDIATSVPRRRLPGLPVGPAIFAAVVTLSLSGCVGAIKEAIEELDDLAEELEDLDAEEMGGIDDDDPAPRTIETVLDRMSGSGVTLLAGDNLELTDIDDEASLDGEWVLYRDPVTCQKNVCNFNSGAELTARGLAGLVSFLGVVHGPHVRGVNMVTVYEGDEDWGESEYVAGFGGWMDESVFFLAVDRDVHLGGALLGMESYSMGVASGSNPSPPNSYTNRASWKGVVAGGDKVIRPSTFGLRIYGNATLTVDFRESTIDAAFTEMLVDAPHAEVIGKRPDIGWVNIPLNSGTFDTQTQGGRIQGAFYGDSHEEVGGVFETATIVGAFGARYTDE